MPTLKALNLITANPPKSGTGTVLADGLVRVQVPLGAKKASAAPTPNCWHSLSGSFSLEIQIAKLEKTRPSMGDSVWGAFI